jgi:molybdopterin/thiamine biosynthesis adenylyltransferase
MDLDDQQVERYSRQIVLSEIGVEGQERLLAADVAVVASGPAARHAVAYLAAAGVGRIAAPAALHDAVDPDQHDVALALPRPDATYDVALIGADDDAGGWRARHVLWIDGPRLGGIPPCPACARDAAADPPPVNPALAAVVPAVVGTVAATEIVKAIVGAGTGLTGRVLAWDAAGAATTMTTVAPRPACAACRRLARGG